MRIVLVGFGVVAQSFAELVDIESKMLAAKYGLKPKIVGIVDSKGSAVSSDGVVLRKALALKRETKSMEGLGPETYDPRMKAIDAIEGVDCEVVVEATPTNLQNGEPGLSHVRAAMKNGRHVICVNKGPLAFAMPALIELAHHNEIIFKFSGTVGGGTPVLDFAKRCLEGSSISSISGILNGTSNFILSKMASEGTEMRDALAEAQKLGYAEADPTYDIGGHDTACKLVIISNHVLGAGLTINDVKITGITEVTKEDVERAKRNGKTVKLIGRMDGVARVSPEEIPLSHPLNVSGTFNAVSFNTDPSGEITLVGKGAGGKETASAVLRDLIEVRRSFSR